MSDLAKRVSDWDGADHLEDCPSRLHVDGDCDCPEDGNCEDAEAEVCECYLGVMRGLRDELTLAEAEVARLRAGILGLRAAHHEGRPEDWEAAVREIEEGTPA